MQEYLLLAVMYLRMLWRYRWVALLSWGGLSLAGWAYVMVIPDVFEVDTKVYLDTRSMLRPLLQGLAVDTTANADAELLMRRTLLVRPNLEAVARKTDLDLTAETPEEFEALVQGLAKQISVKGTAKENIYVIAYENSDPKLATRVVEALLNIFVETSLGQSRKDSSQTKAFLAKQIAEYEARLDAAEGRLKQFRQRNIGLLPSDGTNYFTRLNQAESELQGAMLEMAETEQRRNMLLQQLENVDQLFKVEIPRDRETPAAPPSPMEVRINGLQQRLDDLLLSFTDKHPDVIATQRLLGELEAQREANQAETPAATQTGDSVTTQQLANPLFQELKVALGKEEAAFAAIRARSSEYESRVASLRELIETSLNVEAELQRLDRDYDVNRKNYEELLKRRESLSISDEVSQTTDQVRFNILEPPRVPLLPVAPNRHLYNAAVLILGAGGGVGLALLIALLRPSIYAREDLALLCEAPVLGVVSRMWTPREQFRRRMEVLTFAFAGLCLLSLYGGVSAMVALKLDVIGKATALVQRLL